MMTACAAAIDWTADELGQVAILYIGRYICALEWEWKSIEAARGSADIIGLLESRIEVVVVAVLLRMVVGDLFH